MNDALVSHRSTPHLSASSLRSYIDCSLEYKFSRLDKLQPAFVSSSLLLGSAVHGTVEQCNIIRSEGFYMEQEEALDDFCKRFSHMVKETEAKGIPVKWKEKESFDSAMEQGQSLVRLYAEAADLERVESDAIILATELPFAISLPGVPVPIIGAMDVVQEEKDGSLTIVEVKTTAKSYTTSDIDMTDQLTCYQMALREIGYAGRDVNLRLDTLVKTKVPKLETHYTARTELDEARLTRKLRETWMAIEAGIFLPSDGSWKCSGCAYRKACAEWSLADSSVLTEAA